MLPVGFLDAINAEPWEQVHRLVAADWCADQQGYGYGEDRVLAMIERQLRLGPPPVGLVSYGDGDGSGYGSGSGSGDGYGSGDGSGDGSGYGYGYGDGDGDGDGDGYGSGDGSGYGYGDGDGYGDGYGSGDGSGDGSGYGYGDGIKLIFDGGRTVPEVGKNQLIVLPHGWVICGFVAEQTGPYQFRVERASVICRTGGVPWDELADGKRRDSATCRFWGGCTIGPQFVLSRSWKGELPAGTT